MKGIKIMDKRNFLKSLCALPVISLMPTSSHAKTYENEIRYLNDKIHKILLDYSTDPKMFTGLKLRIDTLIMFNRTSNLKEYYLDITQPLNKSYVNVYLKYAFKNGFNRSYLLSANKSTISFRPSWPLP